MVMLLHLDLLRVTALSLLFGNKSKYYKRRSNGPKSNLIHKMERAQISMQRVMLITQSFHYINTTCSKFQLSPALYIAYIIYEQPLGVICFV